MNNNECIARSLQVTVPAMRAAMRKKSPTLTFKAVKESNEEMVEVRPGRYSIIRPCLDE